MNILILKINNPHWRRAKHLRGSSMDPLLFQFTLDIPPRTKICVPHEQEVVEKPFDVALITGDGERQAPSLKNCWVVT